MDDSILIVEMTLEAVRPINGILLIKKGYGLQKSKI